MTQTGLIRIVVKHQRVILSPRHFRTLFWLFEDRMCPDTYFHVVDYLSEAAKFVPRARLDVEVAIT